MRLCPFTIAFFVVLSAAESLYLFISVVTGNWTGAINSLGAFFVLMLLTYLVSAVLAQMNVC
ncbi:hypothetical protein IPA_03880 [Ignicoccus pacificus DSM 13166]|uniref:Uncharacterized protein n=1 Tax=Ignicoccus pacificus DSM 13166 TaxID=940294 RepID=A0A977KB25_9CREN|nr:hypothetical protein IPA_03880 [Ignicoccus pacificus DSM 13166]